MSKKLAFGIDLGTTNSAISAVVSGVKPEIINLGDGDIMPSCVMWLGGENFVVGKEAYENFAQDNVAHSFKRLMGSNEKITLTYNEESRDFTPEELSSLVLKELAKRAEPMYGKVEDVVITVPAYFTDDQVASTRRAGELAGLNVMSTFREPVASALVYVSEYAEKLENKTERLMVYDLGGGTFDVSIVDVHKTKNFTAIDELYGFTPKPDEENSAGITLSVRGKYGDMFLGGDDIDRELLEVLLRQVNERGYRSEDLTLSSKKRLLHTCESLKKDNRAYSQVVQGELTLVDGTTFDANGITLTQDDVAEAVFKIYERTQCSEAVAEINKASKGKIDSILLIGGSTKSKYIEKYLKDSYPDITINKSLHPDKAVCLGAGLQAHRLISGGGGIVINDVLPLRIGVLSKDVKSNTSRISKILAKNTKVPVVKQKVYRTVVDNQKEIEIDVYQGTSMFPEDNHFIGRLIIDDIPESKAGEIPIFVGLSVNVDGVLSCSASINGNVKTLNLTNIFKGNSPKPEVNKREARMLKAIHKMIAENPEGEKYLKDYEDNKIDIKELYNIVSSLRKDIEVEGVDDETSKRA